MGKIIKRKKGGALIGSGNNTCVYSPPVECTDGSEIPENHVSRIVPSDSIEPGVQEAIKTAIRAMDAKYTKHFNLATKVCKAKFKEVDLTRECDVEGLKGQIKVGPTNLRNMLTPLQESDLIAPDGTLYKDAKTTIMALKDLLHAIVEMNSYAVQVFHTDGHTGNVSWKGDIVVLHDWEKSTVGDTERLKTINGTYVYNILTSEPTKSFLVKFEHWRYIVLSLSVIDSMHAKGYPPTHKSLHFAHQIWFRFWDLFSILSPLSEMFFDITGKMMLVEFELIKKLIKKLFDHLKTVLDTEREEELANPGRLLTEDIKKKKLDAVTESLHELIDSSFIGEYAELLAKGVPREVKLTLKYRMIKGTTVIIPPTIAIQDSRRDVLFTIESSIRDKTVVTSDELSVYRDNIKLGFLMFSQENGGKKWKIIELNSIDGHPPYPATIGSILVTIFKYYALENKITEITAIATSDFKDKIFNRYGIKVSKDGGRRKRRQTRRQTKVRPARGTRKLTKKLHRK
jgi:hypothetical protein